MSSRAWVSTDPDGRQRYRFHQSFVGDTDLCLERTRLGMVGEMPDGPSDATAVGTGLHAAAEHCIEAIMEYGEPIDLDGCIDIGVETFEREMADPTAQWVKRTPEQAAAYLHQSIEMWHRIVMPQLDPLHTELYFGPYAIHEDEHVVVEIAGSIDYVDRQLGLCDWKTGGRHTWHRKDWEKQRWAIQPTVYTYGWHRWSIDNGNSQPTPMPFTYFVMRDDGVTQRMVVTRTEDDWNWMADKLLSLVGLIKADVAPWPKNDTHALCSPKWCPYWGSCKGKHMPASWPK